MSFRAITGTMLSSPGSPARGEVILRRVRTGWTPDDVYLPDEVRLKADADGNVVPGRGYTGDRPVVGGVARAQVWASESSDRQSLYEITITGPMVSGGEVREVVATIAVPTGATPLTLQELLELGSPEGSVRYETLLTYLSGLWRGAWSATPDPAYDRGSYVQSGGSTWIATKDLPAGEPTVANPDWDLVAAGGESVLSDAPALALGDFSFSGSATTASRADHIHPFPTNTDIGAVGEGDPRLTDARTPTLHAATHAGGGSDPLTAGSIGAAALFHAATHGSAGFDPVTPAAIGAEAAGTAATAVSTHAALNSLTAADGTVLGHVKVWKGTQAAYDALTPDADVLYLIEEA